MTLDSLVMATEAFERARHWTFPHSGVVAGGHRLCGAAGPRPTVLTLAHTEAC